MSTVYYNNIIISYHNHLTESITPYKINITNVVNYTEVNDKDKPYQYQAIINVTTHHNTSQLFCIAYPQLHLINPNKKVIDYARYISKYNLLRAYPVNDSNQDMLVDSNCPKHIPRMYVEFGDVIESFIRLLLSFITSIYVIWYIATRT